MFQANRKKVGKWEGGKVGKCKFANYIFFVYNSRSARVIMLQNVNYKKGNKMKKNTVLIAMAIALVMASSTYSVAPANDMFANRIIINGASGTTNGNNSDATLEPGEPCHIYSSIFGYEGYGSNSIWWTWTAPSTATYDFDTRGTSSNVFVCVYTGDSLTNLTKIVYNLRHAPLHATNGITYHIAVVGMDVTSTGQVFLNYYEEQTSPWITEMATTNSGLLAIAAPNGSLASLYIKVVVYAETRTNQFGYMVEMRYNIEFYSQTGITVTDRKGNVIVNNATPPGAGTQYIPMAFNGKTLTVYDQLNSRLISYKVKNEFVLLNEQPLTIEGIFEPILRSGSEILIYQFQLGFPPNYISSGLTAFDIKLKKEKWALPVQPGIVSIHSSKKGISSRETERTYNLNIHFFKKGNSLAKHNVGLPPRGRIEYCTDGKGGILYWTRKHDSWDYINSPLSYISKKGKTVFNNKTLTDSGVMWEHVEDSMKNFVTVVPNGASATLRSYKVNKEMEKIGEANVNNYRDSKFIGKEIMVKQSLSGQEGFIIYNSRLKKKWAESIAPGNLQYLDKGVFMREVITPGAGETNYHFKIFNKTKTLAEHDFTY